MVWFEAKGEMMFDEEGVVEGGSKEKRGLTDNKKTPFLQ